MEQLNYQRDPQAAIHRYTRVDVNMQVSKLDIGFGVPHLHVKHSFVSRGQAYPDKTAPDLCCKASRVRSHARFEDGGGVWLKSGVEMHVHPHGQWN